MPTRRPLLAKRRRTRTPETLLARICPCARRSVARLRVRRRGKTKRPGPVVYNPGSPAAMACALGRWLCAPGFHRVSLCQGRSLFSRAHSEKRLLIPRGSAWMVVFPSIVARSRYCSVVTASTEPNPPPTRPISCGVVRTRNRTIGRTLPVWFRLTPLVLTQPRVTLGSAIHPSA